MTSRTERDVQALLETRVRLLREMVPLAELLRDAHEMDAVARAEERSIRLFNPYPRQAGGRYGPGSMHGESESEGGGGGGGVHGQGARMGARSRSEGGSGGGSGGHAGLSQTHIRPEDMSKWHEDTAPGTGWVGHHYSTAESVASIRAHGVDLMYPGETLHHVAGFYMYERPVDTTRFDFGTNGEHGTEHLMLGVKFEHPLEVNDRQLYEMWHDFRDAHPEISNEPEVAKRNASDPGTPVTPRIRAFTQHLVSMGYDGVRLTNSDHPERPREFIAIKPGTVRVISRDAPPLQFMAEEDSIKLFNPYPRQAGGRYGPGGEHGEGEGEGAGGGIHGQGARMAAQMRGAAGGGGGGGGGGAKGGAKADDLQAEHKGLKTKISRLERSRDALQKLINDNPHDPLRQVNQTKLNRMNARLDDLNSHRQLLEAEMARQAPKQPTIEDLKAAAEQRVKVAQTQARKADRALKDAEKTAETKRTTNAAEITRLSDARHKAWGDAAESSRTVRETITEERAHAKGATGKAPKTYEKMLAAKQPYEEAKAAEAAARVVRDASKAKYDELLERYSADEARYGKAGQRKYYNWYDRMLKDHPDLKAAQRQMFKDESAHSKAQSLLWRRQGQYEGPRDRLAGTVDQAAIDAHPDHIAAKAALAEADRALGEASGQTAVREAYEARFAAHQELDDAKTALAHPTWKYPLHSAPTTHAAYRSIDQWPRGALDAARTADASGVLDRHAGDRSLAELQHAQGFDGKPDIVTEAELAKHIAAGELELWRGDTKPGHTDNLMLGDYHAGLGVHGSGTYTAVASANGAGVARSYAKSSGNDGLIVRMSLKRDARVIAYDKLKELARQTVEKAQRDWQAAQASGDRVAAARAKTLEWLASGKSERGASRFAVALGYDAIDVNTSRNLHGQYIILNRTALRFSHQVRG